MRTRAHTHPVNHKFPKRNKIKSYKEFESIDLWAECCIERRTVCALTTTKLQTDAYVQRMKHSNPD